MGTASEKVSLSTDDLPLDEGLRVWKEHLAAVYCQQDVKFAKPDRFCGQITRRSIGDLTVSSFRSGGAQRVIRTNEMAKADNIEHFHVALPLEGSFNFQQGPVSICAQRDDAFIIDASSNFRIDFSDDANGLVVAIPCDLLRKRIVGIDDFIRKNTLTDSFLLSMIAHFAAKLLHVGSGADPIRIQEFCIDLLDTGVSDARTRAAGGAVFHPQARQLAEKVRTVICERFSDPKLNLIDVALSCGVSRRQVQKVLRENSTTFGQELLHIRLTRASHLLKTRNAVTMSIGQIAAQCGFASQSYFSTCYRDRFGISPRNERR